MKDEYFMQRAFDLAKLGAGFVSPNPMVGAVIVHDNKIIGEGWHQKHGEPHAEVNAYNNVSASNKKLLPDSTIYVSLEPCCFFGKTPACTSLILEQKIPRVVISTLDKTPEVSGKGVSILRGAGVKVKISVLQPQGEAISAYRNYFVTHSTPFVILKYAQSNDGFMGIQKEQVWISNSLSKRLVHKWRSEIDAIMIGTNTALQDNPKLNTRLYFGKSPLRIVLDKDLRLPKRLQLFQDGLPTWLVTSLNPEVSFPKNVFIKIMDFDENMLENILSELRKNNISTLMVEGGSQLLQSFIDQNIWNEARVFESQTTLYRGIKAPSLNLYSKTQYKVKDNFLNIYINHNVKKIP